MYDHKGKPMTFKISLLILKIFSHLLFVHFRPCLWSSGFMKVIFLNLSTVAHWPICLYASFVPDLFNLKLMISTLPATSRNICMKRMLEPRLHHFLPHLHP